MLINQLTVWASDGGEPSKMSKCELTVQVTDVNDNAPKFTIPRDNSTLVYATIVREHVIVNLQVIIKIVFSKIVITKSALKFFNNFILAFLKLNFIMKIYAKIIT